MVVLALFAAQLAHVGNAQSHHRQGRVDLQRGQGSIGERGTHVGQAGQAQVRLVRAKLAHGVVIGDARERRGQRNSGRRKSCRQKLLHYCKHGLLARKTHLQIDLRELKLAIGAQVLVAEATGDLEVAVEAGNHEDLLEDLRRLRQRIKLARMHAAWHQKIARALGRRLGEDGRLDLEKSLLRKALPDGQRNFVPQPEIALHLRPAQIHVTILEPRLLVLNGVFGRRKRRQARVVQHQQLGRLNLDFAGRHLGIDSVLVAQAHLTHRGHHILRPHLLALGVAFGGQLLVQHHLGNAAAVAQIEKDEIAVIAAAVDPAHHHHVLAGLGGAQFAAEIRPFKTS